MRKLGRHWRVPKGTQLLDFQITTRTQLEKFYYSLRSLKKLGGVVTEDQRKRLVEGVILSRLHQHLEVVRMGRKVGLEALQRVQNIAMLWIGGERRRAFRIETLLERLGWLDIGQIAAKASILAALKVIHSGSMTVGHRGLYYLLFQYNHTYKKLLHFIKSSIVKQW